MELIRDIICQVYAGQKSKKTIDLVLNSFLPNYEQLPPDYASRLDDENYIFENQDEMIQYFMDQSGIAQTFYWNQYNDNPDRAMVGANITNDDKLIMSITLDGTEETEAIYLRRLQAILASDVAVVSYVNPVSYDNGMDFLKKYGA